MAAAGCAGDCGGDDNVTVDELLTMVNIALDSAPLTRCQGADVGADGRITVDDLVRAVNNALEGCFPRACVLPPTGMVAWYPLDEGGGSEVRDLTPGHHTGVSGSGPVAYPDGPQPVPGVVGGALAFTGASAGVEVPNAAELNFATGDFSIDAWIDIGNAAPGVQPIVDKRDLGGRAGGVRGYELFSSTGGWAPSWRTPRPATTPARAAVRPAPTTSPPVPRSPTAGRTTSPSRCAAPSARR
jgi:hypothetical protein